MILRKKSNTVYGHKLWNTWTNIHIFEFEVFVTLLGPKTVFLLNKRENIVQVSANMDKRLFEGLSAVSYLKDSDQI